MRALLALAVLAASASAFLDGSRDSVLSAPPSKRAYGALEEPVAQVQQEQQVTTALKRPHRPEHSGVKVVQKAAAPRRASPADIRKEPHSEPHASPQEPAPAPVNAAPQQEPVPLPAPQEAPQQQAKEEAVAQSQPTSNSLRDVTARATNRLRDADLVVARAEAEAAGIQLDAKKVLTPRFALCFLFHSLLAFSIAMRCCGVGGDSGCERPGCSQQEG